MLITMNARVVLILAECFFLSLQLVESIGQWLNTFETNIRTYTAKADLQIECGVGNECQMNAFEGDDFVICRMSILV